MTLQQRDNSRLLWIIIGGISLIVVLFLAAQWLLEKTQNKSEPLTKPAVETRAVPPTHSDIKPETAPHSAAVSEPAPSTLINESVLKAPVPNNASLAKEEVAKLDDIQVQLKDQQSSLKAQHQDADTLIKLKEEQIKLLEAQLTEKK